MPTKVGCLNNILEIASNIPVNIAFDVGHFFTSHYEKENIYSAIERIIEVTKSDSLFTHLSKDIKRKHRKIDIEWCIRFIENVRSKFDLDLHIDIESLDRINECLKLKKYFENENIA